MTTQLIDDLAANKLEQTALEAAAADSAANDAPKLVNSLTVDELKELIADVVDARLTSFFNSLNINGTKKSSEPETLESTELEKENPWLKMAGKYENDPYFDQMLEGIAEYRREQDAELDEYYRQMEIAENNVDSTNIFAEVAAL